MQTLKVACRQGASPLRTQAAWIQLSCISTLNITPLKSSYNNLIIIQGIFLGLSAFGCSAQNFLIRSGAFWKSDTSYYLRVSLYPVHFALYYSQRPFFFNARISSTLYSGSPSILIGGGGSLTCPGKALSGSLNSNTTGNTGQTFIVLGRSNSYNEPLFSTTLKGSSILLSNFLYGRSVYKFFKDSYTLSPISNETSYLFLFV